MESRLVLPVNTVLDGSYRIARVVGSGGFGITYEAEDMNLGTMVAIKEYYPFDFGDRDRTMSVRPKSERHKETFEWGRVNFLQEARTLARFEHPSIVRVTRVFEANSTAYMVMRFEQGKSFEEWLRGLGRLPKQEELDSIVAPLLGALETMHSTNFLHRDIAPDNIIVRADGTPVLLDFGSARRAVAEKSRALTGIVKAGYSPHEQYTSDGRLQGPWSDIYALGGTLYRAVTGNPPEEATLRIDRDHMPPAAQATKGKYRAGFLSAIDACLTVRPSRRPQSVAQLRPMLLGKAAPKATRIVGAGPSSDARPRPAQMGLAVRQIGKHWPAVIATVVVLGGAYAGLEYRRWNSAGSAVSSGEAEAGRKAAQEAAAQRQAALEETRRKEKELADARQRQIEAEDERRRREHTATDEKRKKDEELKTAALEEARRKESAETARRKAEAEAEARRKEELRIAGLEDARRKEEEARRRATTEAEEKRKEEQRIAALEDTRRVEEKRKEDERLRLAAIPKDEERAALVRQVQQVLKRGGCYDGALTGLGNDAQDGLNRFVQHANKRGRVTPRRIELAKAPVGDYETWLKDAGDLKGKVCVVAETKPPPERRPQPPQQRRAPPSYSAPSGGGATIQGVR